MKQVIITVTVTIRLTRQETRFCFLIDIRSIQLLLVEAKEGKYYLTYTMYFMVQIVVSNIQETQVQGYHSVFLWKRKTEIIRC